MDYFVFKNNEQLGPFALMDVRDRLKKGVFSYEDLAWREGMADWSPLSEILGGGLPDATQAVSQRAPDSSGGPRKPIAARIVTALVLFCVLFVLIYFVTAMLFFMVGGGIAGAQSAAATPNAHGFNDGYAIGLQAGQKFRHDYGAIIVLGSLAFSLVLSPIFAGLMAFSNLFPWCRAK